MKETSSRFDFSDFVDEGFEKTDNLEQAIYVFKDGSLWSGYSEGGDGRIRDVDHGTIEAFFKDPSIDRYHPDFWSMTMEEMIQVVPENRMVLILKNNQYSEKQVNVLDQLKKLDFKIEELESTLQIEDERFNLEEYQEAMIDEKKSENYLYDIGIVEENKEVVQAYNQDRMKDKSNENEQFEGISHDIDF